MTMDLNLKSIVTIELVGAIYSSLAFRKEELARIG
jgi:hypothetical protein